MPVIAWRYLPVPLALVLTMSVTSALAASSSAAKAGCPVVTRAQAAAAIGNVKRIEHVVEHTPGAGGGVTWLKQCTIHFRGGAVDLVFDGSDRQSFDEERRGLAELGSVKVFRGLGKAAYLYAPDPGDPGRRELYVFHPSKFMPGHGAFAIRPIAFSTVPVRSLVALARAVLKHPYSPLQNTKR